MPTVAFVTCKKLPDVTDDDRLAANALLARGVRVTPHVWNAPADWRAFDAVVLRSCWDYHLRPAEFFDWVNAREREGARLWNHPAILRWNAEKSYLRDLQSHGVPIVPTVWVAQGQPAQLAQILREHHWARAVVKPAISATAHLTALVNDASAPAAQAHLDEVLRHGAALVQEYLPVHEAGEWSLMFFRGVFSHAVQKFARAGDFRVQNDFGGRAVTAQPDASIIADAQRALTAAQRATAAASPILYARVDGIVHHGVFHLMELELLEPALFLASNAAAPTRFAAALCNIL